MFKSLRARFTLWYTLIFGALLLASSLGYYAMIARSIRARLDLALTNITRTAASQYRAELIENEGSPDVAAAHFLNEFRPPHLSVAMFHDGRWQTFAEDAGVPGTPLSRLIATVPPAEALAKARRSAAPALIDSAAAFSPEGKLAIVDVAQDGAGFYIVIGETREETTAMLAALRRLFSFSFPLMLLLGGAAGLLFVRKSLAPIARMASQAEQLGANNLHQRLPVVHPEDELGRLARVFNDLLGRLDRSFSSMREFTADASHEFRTPLSIIRGEADVALSQGRSPEEYRETLAVIQDEARRLTRLVDDMLALARADSGQRIHQVEEFYLDDLVEECARSFQSLAERNRLTLSLDAGEDISIRGDEELLRRMISNLLDNAVKYTPPGGSVSVALRSDASHVKLTISDTGIGVPADEAGRIFERFYRVDKARSRAVGGSGLGLPIVKWIAELHGGAVELDSRVGQGSAFTVSLPVK
jgi:two-component system, OmpR family, sensor kinase